MEVGPGYESILARLGRWVVEQPDKMVWSFLDDRGDIIDDYTYKVRYH